MNNRVSQAIRYAESHDNRQAYRILREVLRDDPDHESAWLWMSQVARNDRERVVFLRQVLRINPHNEAAKRGLLHLGSPWAAKAPPDRLSVPGEGRGASEIALAADQIKGTVAPTEKGALSGTLSRAARYTVLRAASLVVAVVIAVYLTILIANMGGHVDHIIRANIDQALAFAVGGGWLQGVPTEEKFEIIEQTAEAMAEAQGLNEPFMLRCFRWLSKGLTLDWGETRRSYRGSMSKEVSQVILEALPRSLLMFGTANFFLFFASVFLGLPLTRKFGSWLDKIVIALSPLSSAPAWVYGVILNLLFVRALGVFSLGRSFDAWPAEFTLAYIPYVVRQMILPFLAIFLSGLFQAVYAWRTFFLIYSQEDHVEMGKAKGLRSGVIERRYILRPVLPTLITSFALLLISLWQEVIALEYFFDIAGIGQLLVLAIRSFDIPMIVGLVVTFAYLLAITVFLLDIIYALTDPRVRIAGASRTVRPARLKKTRRFRFWPLRRPLSRPRGAFPPRPALTRSIPQEAKAAFSDQLEIPRKGMSDWIHSLQSALGKVARYPSAMVGMAIIAALIGMSLYALVAIPSDKAIALWRGEGNPWYRNPINAPPAWVNFFRRDDLPNTIILDSRDNPESKSSTVVSEGMTEITISFPFDYPYGAFPQDMTIYFEAQYDAKMPHLSLSWLTPDGREIEMGSFSIPRIDAYHLSGDSRLQRKLEGQRLPQALFSDPTAETPVPLPGAYELRISALVFEEGADLDAEYVLYGQVHGLAGTDVNRRDLMVALLWGAPVALSFGLLAAIGTSISTMVIAAVGVWFGGWVDELTQRITEINMILPFLPVSIMIYTLYSKSFLAILGVTVALGIFGSAIKNYRAIFLQVKDSPYVEAARAYGAGDWRIIFHYLIPRIVSVLIPQLVILVPGYVFLEATLTFLGVSDPVLPTWGKLLVDAFTYGAQRGAYHLVLEPLALLLSTGFAFAMIGYALDSIFNPRLREA